MKPEFVKVGITKANNGGYTLQIRVADEADRTIRVLNYFLTRKELLDGPDFILRLDGFPLNGKLEKVEVENQE